MSPAFDAAIATIVPTVRTAARALPSVQPAAAKSDAIGDERDERDARRRLRRDAHDADDARRDRDEENAEDADARGAHGARQRSHVAREDPGHERGREDDERDAPEDEAAGQVAVRGGDGAGVARRFAAPPRTPLTTARNAPAIVGKFFRTVRMPAVATAPAPM